MTDSTDNDTNLAFPRRVGVLGGGRMGAGIAHAFVLAGSDVTVVERDAEAAAAATGRVIEALEKSVARGAAVDLDDAGARLRAVVGTGGLADRELVIEALPEVFELKATSLRDVEGVISPESVLATNTSSLSVTALGGELTRPEHFLGLHFFNPVPASALIEIVISPRTSQDLRAAAPEWVKALGKTPVVVNDAPGFASSRLGVAIALEAIRMIEEGVASAVDIDLALELGYKHPTGPLKTTDIVGLDVRLGIAEYLHEKLGERFAPPQLLRDKVAAGELGRKTGKGFYDWS